MAHQEEGTGAVIRRLKRPMTRTARKRPTDFFFFGEPEFIATLGDVLSRRGFTVRPADSDYPGLVASMIMADADSFAKTAHWLAGLAGDLGVEFDGWESEDAASPH